MSISWVSFIFIIIIIIIIIIISLRVDAPLLRGYSVFWVLRCRAGKRERFARRSTLGRKVLRDFGLRKP
jgi:hypothetical protein